MLKLVINQLLFQLDPAGKLFKGSHKRILHQNLKINFLNRAISAFIVYAFVGDPR